jgi:membrane protease YdiL (CAAX protease family)
MKKGLIWSALFGLCALLVSVVLYAAHISPLSLIKTPLPKGTPALLWFFVVGGLVAPVAEEVFFRGVVYGFLRRWGVPVAVVGTTVIFVAAHSIGSTVPITQIVGGIVFAVAYEMGGSLMVPIIIHVLGNMAIFGLSLVS